MGSMSCPLASRTGAALPILSGCIIAAASGAAATESSACILVCNGQSAVILPMRTQRRRQAEQAGVTDCLLTSCRGLTATEPARVAQVEVL